MTLLTDAVCPTCGQVHAVGGVRMMGVAVEVCGECRIVEARQAVKDAQSAAAYAARCRYYFEPDRARAVAQAEKTVLLRLVCEGAFARDSRLGKLGRELQTLKNMRRYWELVAEELES